MLGGQARWKITSTAGGSVGAIFMGRYLAGHLYRLKRSIYFGPLILLLGRPPEDITGDVKKKPLRVLKTFIVALFVTERENGYHTRRRMVV